MEHSQCSFLGTVHNYCKCIQLTLSDHGFHICEFSQLQVKKTLTIESVLNIHVLSSPYAIEY